MKQYITTLVLYLSFGHYSYLAQSGQFTIYNKSENSILTKTQHSDSSSYNLLNFRISRPKDFPMPTAEENKNETIQILMAPEFIKIRNEAGEKNWQELDKEIRALLAQYENSKYSWAIIQKASHFMLCEEELLKINSQEAQESISYYTTQLLKTENCDIGIYYHCLNRLQGYWSVDKLADAGMLILQKAEARYLKDKKIIEQENLQIIKDNTPHKAKLLELNERFWKGLSAEYELYHPKLRRLCNDLNRQRS